LSVEDVQTIRGVRADLSHGLHVRDHLGEIRIGWVAGIPTDPTNANIPISTELHLIGSPRLGDAAILHLPFAATEDSGLADALASVDVAGFVFLELLACVLDGVGGAGVVAAVLPAASNHLQRHWDGVDDFDWSGIDAHPAVLAASKNIRCL